MNIIATVFAGFVIVIALGLSLSSMFKSGKSALINLPPQEQENTAPTEIFPTEIIPTNIPERIIDNRCKIGGCSGEICQNKSDEDMASICIAKPEFTCYSSAECTVQDDGNCAWTQTEKLLTCLDANRRLN